MESEVQVPQTTFVLLQYTKQNIWVVNRVIIVFFVMKLCASCLKYNAVMKHFDLSYEQECSSLWPNKRSTSFIAQPTSTVNTDREGR